MKLNKSLNRRSDRSLSLPITVGDNDTVQIKRQGEETEFLYKNFGQNILKLHTKIEIENNDTIEIIEEIEEYKSIIFDQEEIRFCEKYHTFQRFVFFFEDVYFF